MVTGSRWSCACCACCNSTLNHNDSEVQECGTCDDQWCLECAYTLPTEKTVINMDQAIALVAYTPHDNMILIDEIYVRNDKRGMGLAQAMIKSMIIKCPDADTIYLVVRNLQQQQKGAMILYKDKLGMKYVPRNQHVNYPRTDPGIGERLMIGSTKEILRILSERDMISTHMADTKSETEKRDGEIWREIREHHMCRQGDGIDVDETISEADYMIIAIDEPRDRERDTRDRTRDTPNDKQTTPPQRTATQHIPQT